VPRRFLIASADEGTRLQVRRAFNQFDVEPEECAGAMEAFASLHRGYEGVVLDCEDVELSLQLLAGVRSGSEHNDTSIIALLPAGTPVKEALNAGANLAVYKPVRSDHLATSLRVSFRLARPSERERSAPIKVEAK
jgi:DNA-binding response OmpR family regulator